MTLFHPGMIWLLFVGSIPIILHLMLRQKPKTMIFPALRLIQIKRKKSVHRLRLRHFWLMVLRVAVLMGLVFCFARPRVPPANYGFSRWEWLAFGLIVLLLGSVYYFVRQGYCGPRLPVLSREQRLRRLNFGIVVGALLLLGGGVAWPYQARLREELSEARAPVNEQIPVAAVLIFDSSLSMDYLSRSETRLERARELAIEQLGRFPAGSQIAVVDTSTNGPIQPYPDLSAAIDRMGQLTTKPLSLPINDRLKSALRWHLEDRAKLLGDEAEGADGFVREIYILSDLSKSAFRQDDPTELLASLTAQEEVGIYLVDVSAEKPSNRGLSQIRVTPETVTVGGEVSVQAAVTLSGEGPESIPVELFIEDDSGKQVKQEQIDVDGSIEEPVTARFLVRGLTGKVRQGELRIPSDDGLTFDNRIPFSIELKAPPRVLLVADDADEAIYWRLALAPENLVRSGKVRNKVTSIPTGKLGAQKLGEFDAIVLLNVARVSEETWKKIGEFVTQGGGLAVLPGNRVDVVSYEVPAAREILPAHLLAYVSFDPEETLDLPDLEHPLIRPFIDWGGAGDLTIAPVRRAWKVQPDATASVIGRFTDEKRTPAILDRSVGKGRSLLYTTPFNRSTWNDLWSSGWQYAALIDLSVRYLTRQSDGRCNFVSGEDIVLRLPESFVVPAYLLRRPNLTQIRGNLNPGQKNLLIVAPDQIGSYLLNSIDPEQDWVRALSVQPNPTENVLAKIPANELNAILGEGRYEVGRDWKELNRTLSTARIGQELYPLVIALLLVLFVAETIFSNRFYDVPPTNPVSVQPTTGAAVAS